MISDNGKLILMYALIGFILIIIGSFIIIGILSVDEAKEENNYEPLTTTIRTYESSSTTTITTTTTAITSTNSTTSITTTKTTSTKKISTTKKKSTTKKTTKKTTTKVVEDNDDEISNNNRVTTESNSTYPNALDSWEWEIVDRINEERKKNGLEELEVAVDLRRLAEEGADFWYEYNDDEIDDYLESFSHYGFKSNMLEDDSYWYLYELTKKNTNVTTDKYLKYLGVGVIRRSPTLGGLDTYYYIIIYE